MLDLILPMSSRRQIQLALDTEAVLSLNKYDLQAELERFPNKARTLYMLHVFLHENTASLRKGAVTLGVLSLETKPVCASCLFLTMYGIIISP